MAFLFVDRITDLEPGRLARGSFRVPFEAPDWPAFLLAEAVGQLAGWAAMAHLDFQSRPVAALAGEVAILGQATPGAEVELAVHLDRFDRGAVLYGGTASAAGQPLLEMSRCVGPLLPIDDFEDPAAARARYERLRQGDGEPSSFVSIEPPRCDIVHLEPGVAVRATMQVPSRAALFADHFPRRAVYPATLLLDRQMRLVQPLLPGRDWQARSVTHVKIGAFVLPGDELTLEASLMSDAGDERLFALVGFRGETRISRARAHYVRCGV